MSGLSGVQPRLGAVGIFEDADSDPAGDEGRERPGQQETVLVGHDEGPARQGPIAHDSAGLMGQLEHVARREYDLPGLPGINQFRAVVDPAARHLAKMPSDVGRGERPLDSSTHQAPDRVDL
jgi:hypothetical protein